MSDTRDTLILPCRHLCLCNSCADSLRYQANNCPICRAPFRALLQIRAVQKNFNGALANVTSQQQALQESNTENIPPGYIAVSLIEALNGPTQNMVSIKSQPDVAVTSLNDADATRAAAEALNRCELTALNDKSCNANNKDNASEMCMTTVLPKDESAGQKINGMTRDKSPRQKSFKANKAMLSRDSLALINEKNATSVQSIEQDEDSDTGNLSPLLHTNAKSLLKHVKKLSGLPSSTSSHAQQQHQQKQLEPQFSQTQAALQIDGVIKSIDENDTDAEERNKEVRIDN